MIIEAVLFLVLVGLVLATLFDRKLPAGMPPGSLGLPVFGNLPPRHVSMAQYVKDLKKKHGDIFTTKWGSYLMVIITDYQIMKKAFYNPDIQGRPDFLSSQIVNSYANSGVVQSFGEVWSRNRRTVLRMLRDLGMGKLSLQDSIQDEAVQLVKYLQKECVGKPAEMDLFINNCILNVIWQMTASKRYDIDDPEVIEFTSRFNNIIKLLQSAPIFAMDVFKWFRNWMPGFLIKNVAKIEENRDAIDAMHKRFIKEHIKALDPENPRDVIDYVLIERLDMATKTLSKEDEQDLVSIMNDMFGAGSETTSTTLRWMILFLALQPEVQAKAQKAIDEAVPRSRLPCLNDKDQLPYIEAMLLDVLRLSSLVPNSAMHTATKDTTLEGYTIPKGTVVMICPELSHKDANVWKEPNKLCPEHFLDSQGNLEAKREHFLPFSIGRRQCVGENLAKMEVFLFATAILQKFTIKAPPGVTLTTETDPSEKLLKAPPKYQVILENRV